MKKRKGKQNKKNNHKKDSNLPFGIHHEAGETGRLWSPYGFSVFLMSFLSPTLCSPCFFVGRSNHLNKRGTSSNHCSKRYSLVPCVTVSAVHLRHYHRDSRPKHGSASRASTAGAPSPKPASLGRINSSLPRKK